MMMNVMVPAEGADPEKEKEVRERNILHPQTEDGGERILRVRHQDKAVRTGEKTGAARIYLMILLMTF